MLLIDTRTEFKLNKIGEKGYRDAHNSIIRLMECIRIHSEWSKISENEKIRYSFMFKTLDKILTQLTKREFPLPVTKDVEVRKRLSFYYKKYIEGNLGFDLKSFNDIDFTEEAHERDNLPNPFDNLSIEELLYIREHHYFLD